MVRAVVGVCVLFLAFGAIVSGARIAQIARAEHDVAAVPVLARREAENLWTNEEALSSLRVEGFKQKRQKLRLKRERRKADRSESSAARRRRLRARRTRRRPGVGATVIPASCGETPTLACLVRSCAKQIPQVAPAVVSHYSQPQAFCILELLRSLKRWRVVTILPVCFRGILLSVLSRGCASGDMAAGGACMLWILGVHASTTASCSAFTMLVMLGLDASVCSFEFKIALCAVSAVSPLFPPKRRSTPPEARAHIPLIVEALEFQHPEAEHDGGELVCDEPPPSSAQATSHESTMHMRTVPELQAPEAEVDGGEILCDKPPLSLPGRPHGVAFSRPRKKGL